MCGKPRGGKTPSDDCKCDIQPYLCIAVRFLFRNNRHNRRFLFCYGLGCEVMPGAASHAGLYRDASNRPPAVDARAAWRQAYDAVRAETERRAAPLTAEDQCVQSMPDASPIKWHRAHTTWFFEQFLLAPHRSGYQAFDPRFSYLFNSYYVAAGP